MPRVHGTCGAAPRGMAACPRRSFAHFITWRTVAILAWLAVRVVHARRSKRPSTRTLVTGPICLGSLAWLQHAA
eukprot:80571-Chlamydomonas_euryale.AAC.2